MRAALVVLAGFFLASCGRYRDFTLPIRSGGPSVSWHWQARLDPVLTRAKGDWDSVDVLNPSVVRQGDAYYNLYSGFDGKTWHTGMAVSGDGVSWRRVGKILSPDPRTWEGDAIAANGSALADEIGGFLYYYQAGAPVRIGLARSANGHQWEKNPAPVLDVGPRGSWDEGGVADPCVIRIARTYYMFYLGVDRARRQRLGVAMSDDGQAWYKLRSNPILELGSGGAFDENGLGEPAVWASRGYYWMLYTGRDRNEVRRLGMARSLDGVHWDRIPPVIGGDQPWDSKVLCDPSVLMDDGHLRVWFGGGDVARPDHNIHGQIGLAELSLFSNPAPGR